MTPSPFLLAAWLLASSPAGAPAPFACDMTAMSRSERTEHAKLMREMFGRVLEERELPDGYAFELPPSSLVDVARWASLERRCCPFFTFRMELAGDRGPFWLSITGAEGVKAFMRSELGLDAAR